MVYNGDAMTDDLAPDAAATLELHLPQSRKEALEAKLSLLQFDSYQQFAEACASLLLSGHATFVAVVGGACHPERDVPQMSWTEPGKDSDDI
jgi:hypothetical protein